MSKSMFDVIVGIAVILGTLFGAMTLYYTAAVYYEWKPSEGGLKAILISDSKMLLIGLLGVAVLISSWGLVAVRTGWLGSSSVVNRAQLERFMDNFERLAAEESYMAVMMRQDIPYNRFDQQGVTDPNEQVKKIGETERRDWRTFLENLRADCIALGLKQTTKAIDGALRYFSDDYIDATRITSWQAYNRVSVALKNEMAEKGGIGLNSE